MAKKIKIGDNVSFRFAGSPVFGRVDDIQSNKAQVIDAEDFQYPVLVSELKLINKKIEL